MTKPVLKIQNLGIDNVTAVFVAVLTVASRFRVLVRDFTYGKLVTFLVGILDFAPLIAVSNQAWEEFKDLDNREYEMVVANVKAQFDIPDDKFEDAIEDALDLTRTAYNLVAGGLALLDKIKEYIDEHLKGEEEQV